MKSFFTKDYAAVLALLWITTTVSYAQLGDGWKSQTLTKKVHIDDASGLQIYNWTPLTFSSDGNVVVEASQPGNENYLAALTVEQSILVYSDDDKNDGIKLIVHPNPTKGKLKVKLDNKKDKQYTFAVYDEHGNIVESKVIPKSPKMFEVDFDLSGSPVVPTICGYRMVRRSS